MFTIAIDRFNLIKYSTYEAFLNVCSVNILPQAGFELGSLGPQAIML